MGRIRKLSVVGVVVLSAVAASATPGGVPVPDTAATTRSEIERLGEGRFRIGAILLDKTSQTLRLPAEVNMRKGMIELVACSSGGKLHESVFLVHAEPVHLQLSLLLLGLRSKESLRQGDPQKKVEADQVVIYVEKDGLQRRVEDYIWDLQRQAPMERTGWVFTGSKVIEGGGFAAQMTRTLITTYRDPYTILDNPLPTGEDDTVYEVNSRMTPSVGTSVTLVLTPLKKTVGKGEKK